MVVAPGKDPVSTCVEPVPVPRRTEARASLWARVPDTTCGEPDVAGAVRVWVGGQSARAPRVTGRRARVIGRWRGPAGG